MFTKSSLEFRVHEAISDLQERTDFSGLITPETELTTMDGDSLKSKEMMEETRTLRPAVFLDRDGTLNEEVHYLSAPEQLVLLPTAAETIRDLNSQGIAVVVITNQAGIARGYFPEDRLIPIHERLCEMLAEYDAHLDGIYYCPHHPTAGVGEYRIECKCRKPSPGMLTRAACELGIDLSKSFMIGDRDSDLMAGANAGCQTALVRTGYGEETSQTIDLAAVRGIGTYDHVGDAVKAWLLQFR